MNNKRDPNTWDEYEPLIGGDDVDQARIKTLNQTLNSLLHQVEDLRRERDSLVSAFNDMSLRAQAAEAEENDLRRALKEARDWFTAENFRAQALEGLKRSAEEEVVDLHRRMSFDHQELEELNKRLDAYEKKEPPLLQCIDCRNTESCAGAMARQFNHGRCLHCGGYFKVVRA